MYHAVKESEGSHSEEAHMEGDYEVCFDNRMSTWAEKVVWLEITLHDPTDDYYEDYIGDYGTSLLGEIVGSNLPNLQIRRR